MRSIIKTKKIQPLVDLVRQFSAKLEFAIIAVSYVLLLSIRQGKSFPLSNLDDIISGKKDIPKYVKDFINKCLAEHWNEYQQKIGVFDEDTLVDFFSNDATALLLDNRDELSTHPIIDQLCLNLLEISNGNTVADLNCGTGKLVRRAWFSLWDVCGSDAGLNVVGYSLNPDLAAITYILCDVAEIGVKVIPSSIFTQQREKYDRVVLIPPLGVETRTINIPMAQKMLDERFNKFPELRRSSADWVFAARAVSLLSSKGRAVVAVSMQALNGKQSQPYREFLIRNRLIEAVISIPKGFLNGTQINFALVVMREDVKEIKFVNGEEYFREIDGQSILDVDTLLKDYRDLNDFEAVTTKSLESVFSQNCNLTPDFYLGENLIYNNYYPLGNKVNKIRRGAKLSISEWNSVAGDESSLVKKVAFKHLSDGLIDEALPGLTRVPVGGEDAVLETGDLLISRMGYPFKIAVVDSRNEKLVADENLWIVRMNGNKKLAYYLRAYLESERGAKWLLRLSTGALLRTISAKNIEKIPVPVVDDKTCSEIAEELEKYTIFVRENRRQLDESLNTMKNVFNNFNKNGDL